VKVLCIDMEQVKCLLHGSCVECILSYPTCKVHGPYCIVACGLHHSLSTSSHKWYDFRSIVIGCKMCVLICFRILSETFCIPRRIQRDAIRTVRRSAACNVLRLFWSDFNETWIFSTAFRKVLKYQNLLKFSQWQLICSMWTNRHTWQSL
jgi:hypothetical protein